MKKNQLFQWLSLQQQAFEKIKQVLAIAKVISYSDPKKETELITDTFPISFSTILDYYRKYLGIKKSK